jgi:hypothetical protein
VKSAANVDNMALLVTSGDVTDEAGASQNSKEKGKRRKAKVI